jgi:predicted secreted protein
MSTAAFPGRTVAVTWNSAALACREKGVTVNGEPLDVSDDSSAGWRVLDTELGEQSVNVSVSGLTKAHTLRHGIGTQATLTVTYPTGQGSFTGTFQLASYSEGAPYKESVTFDAEFQSTGVVTFTPPA